MTNQPNCPACRVAMDAGYTFDHVSHSSLRQAQWVEGMPEKSFWTGLKTKDRDVRPIVTFRCPRCGMLASFAPDKGASA